jgi:hypothetical protein
MGVNPTAKPAFEQVHGRDMVPLAGIEPALLAELDFESSASTNSATGALRRTVRQYTADMVPVKRIARN